MSTKRVKDPLNEGFNKMFKNLLNEDMKRDDIDADADDKKELAKKNFMKKKDDADSDRDYKLKKAGLKESADHAALELAEKDYAFNPLTGDVLLHRDVEYNPEVGEVIELKFLDDNDDKWYTYKVTETQKDSKYPYICEYISEKKEFVESKKSLKESDKPAATSIKDAQKWVDYDMMKYGKISQRTNDLVKKAGFQIIKDDHGDYEVTVGKFESYKKILGAKGKIRK